MENQSLSVTERLKAWCEEYAPALGENLVAQALEFAEDCYLAFKFELRPDARDEYFPAGLPREAIISTTRFGEHRPPGRPTDARPAEHAAHLLKRTGVGETAVADYLKALHPWPSLDQHEINKRLRDCEQRVSDTAKNAASSILASASGVALKEQLEVAQQLEVEMMSYPGHLSPGELIAIVRGRIELVSRIKAGEFGGLAPIVFVRTRHPVGHDLALGEGESFKISWGRHALGRARADAAALVSVPGWYPFWEA